LFEPARVSTDSPCTQVSIRPPLGWWRSTLVSGALRRPIAPKGPPPSMGTTHWTVSRGRACRSNQDDIGTLYTEAPGVEVQGTKPEAERITPYPAPSEHASVGTNYSARSKAQDGLKDFQYQVSYDRLGRDATRDHGARVRNKTRTPISVSGYPCDNIMFTSRRKDSLFV